jgi:GNAT superfamily N-acetyltransferase
MPLFPSAIDKSILEDTMKITQRTATLNDAAILLNWRNDKSTRKFSRQSEKINPDEHIEWLIARLKRVRAEPFYLFDSEFGAIGMCRLDAISGSASKYEISILVEPSQHGKGIGTRILSLTCESFFELYPNYAIVAYIDGENYVSQKLFLSAGFKLMPSLGKLLHFEKTLN